MCKEQDTDSSTTHMALSRAMHACMQVRNSVASRVFHW